MVTEKMIEAAARAMHDAVSKSLSSGPTYITWDKVSPATRRIYTSQARATLLAAEAAAWEGMETAPRDREVWYYAPPSDGLPSLQGRVKYHPDAGFCVDEFREPTHWRPLPTPPETSDA